MAAATVAPTILAAATEAAATAAATTVAAATEAAANEESLTLTLTGEVRLDQPFLKTNC